MIMSSYTGFFFTSSRCLIPRFFIVCLYFLSGTTAVFPKKCHPKVNFHFLNSIQVLRKKLSVGLRIAMLPFLLSTVLFSSPSIAGLAEDIKDDVKDARSFSKSAKSFAKNASTGVDKLTDTEGMLKMVTDVNIMKSTLPLGFFESLKEDHSLEEKMKLFKLVADFYKESGSGQEIDLQALVNALKAIVRQLTPPNDPPASFGILETLIDAGGESIVAAAAHALDVVGINQNLVATLEDLATPLALMTEALVLDQIEQRQEDNAEAEEYGLAGATGCTSMNDNRQEVKIAAGTVEAVGITLRMNGKLLDTHAAAINTNVGAAVWGWVGADVDQDISAAMGTALGGLGEVFGLVSNAAFTRLYHCELLFEEKKTFVQQQEILVNQAAILRELCTITRFRSTACQALSQ
jgi:hypothetical protein